MGPSSKKPLKLNFPTTVIKNIVRVKFFPFLFWVEESLCGFALHPNSANAKTECWKLIRQLHFFVVFCQAKDFITRVEWVGRSRKHCCSFFFKGRFRSRRLFKLVEWLVGWQFVRTEKLVSNQKRIWIVLFCFVYDNWKLSLKSKWA